MNKAKLHIYNNPIGGNMKIAKYFRVSLMLLSMVVTASAKEKTVEGELIDVTCFAGMGAKGAQHEMCAVACAKNGQPIGVLTSDGKVYNLLTIVPKLADQMSKTVKIKGEFHKASQSIKPAKMWVKENGKSREI